MGFGAGFGPAFSNAFNQQRERSHERQTDEFRYRMETLIKSKDKYDTQKKAGEAAVSQAKQIVELSGQPPEAVGKIYEMLRDGWDAGDVLKLAQSKKFNVTKPAEEAAKPEDKQMTDSGLAGSGPESTQPAPPLPAPGLNGGGFLGQVFPGMKKFTPQGTDARVQKTTGMSAEEIAQIDAGYTPPSIPVSEGTWSNVTEPTNDPVEAKRLYDEAARAAQADPQNQELAANAEAMRHQYESVVSGTQVKANAGGFGQTPSSIGTMDIVVTKPDGTKEKAVGQMSADGTFTVDGQPVNARARSDDEKEREQKIIASLGEPAQKQMTAANELAQAYVAYGNARKIIVDNPTVINDRTANVDRYIVDLGKDIVAGMDLVNQTLANPETADPNALVKVEQELEAAKDDVNLGPMQKLAAARSLLKVQYAIGAYHIAAAMGQDGRALQENERKMFTELPDGFTSLQQWDQGIGSLLVPQKQALDKKAQLLPEANLDYKRFVKDYGYSPVGDITNMDKYLEGTPGADLDQVLPQGGYKAVVPTPDTVPNPAKDAPAEYPGYTYTGKLTKDGKRLYKDVDGNIGTMD